MMEAHAEWAFQTWRTASKANARTMLKEMEAHVTPGRPIVYREVEDAWRSANSQRIAWDLLLGQWNQWFGSLPMLSILRPDLQWGKFADDKRLAFGGQRAVNNPEGSGARSGGHS